MRKFIVKFRYCAEIEVEAEDSNSAEQKFLEMDDKLYQGEVTALDVTEISEIKE